MMKRLIIGSMCLLMSFGSIAQKKEIEFTEFDLDNGMHVILHQDNTTPIVVVSVMYHVGSKNENPERTGFAHFFEHLLFEGSKNIERGEFDKYITNAGGVNNANTSNDRTYYYEVLPSNQLKLGLWLESERLMHAQIQEIGVETQREVVKEEKRQRYDNQPYGTFIPEIMKRAYTEHPYQWTPIGSLEHLNEASLDEFVEFYETFYVPENATLSIAGDIEIEEAKKLIKDYFGPIPRGGKEIPRPDIVEPKQKEEVRDTIYDNIQLPALFQAYHTPAQGTKDSYALEMLSTVLSGGQSARMYKSLVDEQQKALQISSFPFSTEDPGLYLLIGIPTVGGDLKELEAGIDAEIKKVQEELITEREFEKIRNQKENDFITGNSRMTGIAESLANYHVYYGDANLINKEIDRFMDVTREDIKRVANEYLTEENRVVLYYLPKSQQNQ
ncbi:pitrilysin family protein [Marivirga tractuosa]|uniref:M16 family metallopeptidase n=1 Tax=Marivirga tractuosa TaxID=1006 RepID=UPI0035D0B38E